MAIPTRGRPALAGLVLRPVSRAVNGPGSATALALKDEPIRLAASRREIGTKSSIRAGAIVCRSILPPPARPRLRALSHYS